MSPRILSALALFALGVPAFADWPMGGRDHTRNPVSPETGAPTDWQVKTADLPARNIKWSAKVGSRAIGGPVVANGLVWVGTNNDDELDPAVKGDRGVLACFRESDGKFLYQYASKRLEIAHIADWGSSGLGCAPVAEKDRLWFVTNRREVVCLDTGPLSRGTGPAVELWKYDLVKEQKVFPNSPMVPSHTNVGCPAVYKDWLFVPTGNGVDADHPGASAVRNPDAPSLVCFRKDTGKVVWKDNSPGKRAFGGHHSAPLVAVVGGKPQVIQSHGDGWVRAFDAPTGKTLWSFEVSPKGAVWEWKIGASLSARVAVATPVFADGRVYFAAGREPEFAGGPGRLFCVDPTKTGDISPELADGRGKSKPNPNSGLVWDFTWSGKKDDEEMAQTTSSVAVHAGLVIAPDRWGVHCLDAKTGKHHWTHRVRGSIFGDPLIVDGKVCVGDNDGTMTMFELSKAKKVVFKHAGNSGICASPVFANGALYVLTDTKLYAIEGRDPPPKK